MNPESPANRRQTLEVSLTALILGELPPDHAAALQEVLEHDPELARTYERLKKAASLIQEAETAAPIDAPPPTKLKLGSERRETLLRTFKPITPLPLPGRRSTKLSRRLAPVGIAAVLMLTLTMMLGPSLSRSKFKSSSQTAAVTRRMEAMKRELSRTDLAQGGTSLPTLTVRNGLVDAAGRIDTSSGPAANEGKLRIVLPESAVADRSITVPAGSPSVVSTVNEEMSKLDTTEVFRRSYGEFAYIVPPASDNRSSAAAAPADGLNAGAAVNQTSAGQKPTPELNLNFSKNGQDLATVVGKPSMIIAAAPPAPSLSVGAPSRSKSGESISLGDLPVVGRTFYPTQNPSADTGSVYDLGVVGYINLPLTNGLYADVRTFYRHFNDESGLAQSADQYWAEHRSEQDIEHMKQGGSLLAGGAQDIKGLADRDAIRRKLLEASQSVVVADKAKLERTRESRPQAGAMGGASKKVEESAVNHGAKEAVQETRAAVAKSPAESAVEQKQLPGAIELQTVEKTADAPLAKPASPPPIPQPEFETRNNAFSTFSLNVSDVSFKLAAASLEKGTLPEASSIRSEEFINAFNYRDPEARPGVPVAFAWERAQFPFAHNRDLLRFSVKTAAQGREAGRPLNLVLLLDNSGSMERADRVAIIREALRVLATQLRPHDLLSVVTFARTAQLRVDGVSGTEASRVAEELSSLTPQGGTNLGEALSLAYQAALKHYLAGGINRVVLLTDGAANLGEVDPAALQHQVETHRKQGVALDCFGIGWEGFNDDLLETLTRHGDGRYGFLNTPAEAAEGFAGQLAGALHVAAANVKVQVEFNPARVSAHRQIGYARHQLTQQQFRDNTVDAAELGAAESGNALYVIAPLPAGTGPLATVRVRYQVPGTSNYREQEWVVPYEGAAPALEQASPAIRLAATAGTYAEWLAGSPFLTDVSSDRLLTYLRGVPEAYGADKRPQKLEWMLRQTKSLSGQ